MMLAQILSTNDVLRSFITSDLEAYFSSVNLNAKSVFAIFLSYLKRL